MDIPRSIDTLRKSGGVEALRQLGRPLAFAVVAVMAVTALVLVLDPSSLSVPLDKWVDDVTDWVTVAWHPLFHAISTGVLWVLVRFERFLIGLPVWEVRDWEIGYAIIAPVAFVAWRTVGWKLAAIAVGGLLFIGNVRLWSETMSTVAVVGTATIIAVAFAVATGILMARSDRVGGAHAPGSGWHADHAQLRLPGASHHALWPGKGPCGVRHCYLRRPTSHATYKPGYPPGRPGTHRGGQGVRHHILATPPKGPSSPWPGPLSWQGSTRPS